MPQAIPFAIPPDVRRVALEGREWFVAADVLDALGLDTSGGTGWYTGRLAREERATATMTHGTRGNPRRTIIPESAVYRFALRSDHHAARPLQDWVCRDVLPALAQRGEYRMGEA